MEKELKSLADLPEMGAVQDTPEQNSNQEQQQPTPESRPVSKYAAKQRRKSFSLPQPKQPRQHSQMQQPLQHGQAALDDAEKWVTVVHLATSLDQISGKLENLENRLNALVLPESDGKDLETLAETTGEALKASANSIVNLVRVSLEEQCQDLRDRQKALQTQITNDVTTARERINARLSEVWDEVIDTRDLIRELMRRVGDPADTPLASRMREVQYIVKRLENPPDDPKEDPQDRTHWLPRWACQLLFDADQIHVTDHGVWTETRVGDKIDFGGSSLLELWKNIRAAKKAYKVQQKIQKLQAKLDNTAAK